MPPFAPMKPYKCTTVESLRHLYTQIELKYPCDTSQSVQKHMTSTSEIETSFQPTPKIQDVHASDSELLLKDQNLRVLIFLLLDILKLSDCRIRL